MVSADRDAYEILQIHPSALPEVVEAAYRALALVHHPDRNGDRNSALMAELNWAYATLRDPERRIAYDRTRVPIPVGASVRSSLLDRMQGTMASAAERNSDSPARVIVDFGRYEGMSLAQIARVDRPYLEWLRRHSAGVRYRHGIDAALAGSVARRTTPVTEA